MSLFLVKSAAPFRTELQLLSQIVLAHDCREAILHLGSAGEHRAVFERAAQLNHVVVRAFRPLLAEALTQGEPLLAEWASKVLVQEERRIINTLAFANSICREFEASGCPALVMKSLDHWPDIGNDLDLLTAAEQRVTRSLLQRAFLAEACPRSWGDHLASKCGFRIPGMDVTIEVHHGCLGQTGEHRELAQRFILRRVRRQFLGYTVMVPAPEEQVIAATLQRMYRHFYFRICDIANTGALIESGTLDYEELRAVAISAGIWPGVSSYLNIVAGYLRQFRSREVELPAFLTNEATCSNEALFPRGPWLRVPIFPECMSLYGKQLAAMLRGGNLRGTCRLGLLPPLASAAKLAQFVTGDHRGIW
jgi:Uncharacterised nucleotidyltransferase